MSTKAYDPSMAVMSSLEDSLNRYAEPGTTSVTSGGTYPSPFKTVVWLQIFTNQLLQVLLCFRLLVSPDFQIKTSTPLKLEPAVATNQVFHQGTAGGATTMVELTYYDTGYLVARFMLWLTLGVALTIDYMRYRTTIKAQGWQLFAGVGCVTGIYVIQCAFSVAWWTPGSDNADAYRGFIFFYALADSAFLCLLLLISTGYCITRSRLKGSAKCWVICFPVVNFVSTLIVEYIFDNVVGHVGNSHEPVYVENEKTRRILLASAFLSLLTYVYAWYYVFISLEDEKKYLINKIKEKDQARDTAAETSQFAIDDQLDAAEENKAADSEENDTLPDKSKLRLLKSFSYLILAYFIGILFVAFYDAWAKSSHSLDVAFDTLRLVLLTGLGVIFRLRPQNQYYLLEDYDDYEEGAGSVEMGTITAVNEAEPITPARAAAPPPPSPTPFTFEPLDDGPDSDEEACTPPPGPTPRRLSSA